MPFRAFDMPLPRFTTIGAHETFSMLEIFEG
jgi:hypothetical protein